MAAVLHLLRREDLLSRTLGVIPATLSRWCDHFATTDCGGPQSRQD
jgi:hypothetical protein